MVVGRVRSRHDGSRRRRRGGQGELQRPVNFTHNIDKASPVLLQACATGEHIKEATITHRKAGKGQQEFLIIKMNDVIITGVTHGGSGDGGHRENVSLAVRQGRLWNTSRRRPTARSTPASISSTTSRATRKGSHGRGRARASNRTSRQKADECDSSKSSNGAGDMFLMVKGAKHGLIKGESQDAQHKGEIDVVELVVGDAGQSRRSAAAPQREKPPSTI